MTCVAVVAIVVNMIEIQSFHDMSEAEYEYRLAHDAEDPEWPMCWGCGERHHVDEMTPRLLPRLVYVCGVCREDESTERRGG